MRFFASFLCYLMNLRPPKLTKEQIIGLTYFYLTVIPFHYDKCDRDLHIQNTITCNHELQFLFKTQYQVLTMALYSYLKGI